MYFTYKYLCLRWLEYFYYQCAISLFLDCDNIVVVLRDYLVALIQCFYI